MIKDPNCPKCNCEYPYPDGNLWVCPACGYEWIPQTEAATITTAAAVGSQIKDAHGNILKDGDSVTVVKDLKIKGSSSSVKVGTKVKSIRLIESDDGHNIACKIEGIGAINLKSEFVKKA